MKLERQLTVRHPVGSSSERRYLAQVTACITLWRMIAVGLLLGPPLALILERPAVEPSKHEFTRAVVRVYAFEAFPQWASTHAEAACPGSLAELSPFAHREHALDAWGGELELRCGNGIRGAYVRSAGPDGRFETADDISSND